MNSLDDHPLDPAHRMLLSIAYTRRGGVGHVEAVAVPTWRDRAIDATLHDPSLGRTCAEEEMPPIRSAVPQGPLPADEDITLLFMHGARLILRFDDGPASTG